MALLSNGQIDPAYLAPAAGTPGARLRRGAANSWATLRATVYARYGWWPTLTSAADAYRTYEIQRSIFLQRYQTTRIAYSPGRYDMRAWNGRPYWRKPGYAAAAVPGTSNHGWGKAVDIALIGSVTGARYRQFKSVAEPLKWSNVEGLSVNEPWHWVYLGDLDQVSNPIGGGGSIPNIPTVPVTPISPIEKEDIVATLDQMNQSINERLVPLYALINDLSKPELFRIFGTAGAWLDLGTARRALSAEVFYAMEKPIIQDLPASDVFWDLPVAGFPTEVISKPGEDAVWLRVPGGRQWIHEATFVKWRRPLITKLDGTDPFWGLATVGELPPLKEVK